MSPLSNNDLRPKAFKVNGLLFNAVEHLHHNIVQVQQVQQSLLSHMKYIQLLNSIYI